MMKLGHARWSHVRDDAIPQIVARAAAPSADMVAQEELGHDLNAVCLVQSLHAYLLIIPFSSCNTVEAV